MRKEILFGIAIEIIGNGTGIGLQMLGYINPVLGLAIIGISNMAGLSLIVYGIRKKDVPTIEREKYISDKWEHYNKLTNLILSLDNLENATHNEWSAVIADMQRELNAIGDITINKMVKILFDALKEYEYVGITASRGVINGILDRTREYMILKYKR